MPNTIYELVEVPGPGLAGITPGSLPQYVLQAGVAGVPGTPFYVKEVSGAPILCTTLVFPNGSLTNLGSGVVQVAFAVSPPPPPAYTPSLDFSDARNSQYIALIY